MKKLTLSASVPWDPRKIASGLTGDGKNHVSYFESLIRFLKKQFDDITQVINLFITSPEGENFKITSEGGYAIKLINNTGASTVRGQALAVATIDMAVDLTAVDAINCIGTWYESGVSNGEKAWVVVSGIAPYLLKNSTFSAAGNWIVPSDITGRFNAEAILPPAGSLSAYSTHFGESGQCLETQAGGTDIVVMGVMHFN